MKSREEKIRFCIKKNVQKQMDSHIQFLEVGGDGTMDTLRAFEQLHKQNEEHKWILNR